MADIPRLLFAAPGSGGGKTTVTCGFLQVLHNRGLSPVAFKCGPDYIDPMFHSEIIGIPSRNLDLFFAPEQTVRGLLARHGAGHTAVLEGVMGFYDGVADTDRASSWHLASATDTPVILILDPKGMSLSLAALVQGILGFRRPSRVAGLLLNRCSASLYAHLTPLLERETGLPVLGHLPPMPQCAIESRHLGLVTAAEVENLREKVHAIAAALEAHVDIDRILQIAREAPPVGEELPRHKPVTGVRPVIAVAEDRAFCFRYRDNLDLLEELGAVLIPFSPLTDSALPPDASALYLSGGYPELYASQLSKNASMREALGIAYRAGMPIFAECGGFQYLQEFLEDDRGAAHPMVGVLPGGSRPTGGLRRFGYVTLTAGRDTLLCRAGDTIAAHEFHHWDSDYTGDAFSARKPSGKEWPCIVWKDNLFAGYPHLYFHSNPGFAARFVEAAAAYAERTTSQ